MSIIIISGVVLWHKTRYHIILCCCPPRRGVHCNISTGVGAINRNCTLIIIQNYRGRGAGSWSEDMSAPGWCDQDLVVITLIPHQGWWQINAGCYDCGDQVCNCNCSVALHPAAASWCLAPVWTQCPCPVNTRTNSVWPPGLCWHMTWSVVDMFPLIVL